MEEKNPNTISQDACGQGKSSCPLVDRIELRECTYDDILPLRAMLKEHVAMSPGGNTIYIGAYLDGRIVGCVGYQVIGSVIRYKTDYVVPEYRGHGIYRRLFVERDIRFAGDNRKRTSFCTSMSKGTYVRYGFKVKKVQRNGISFLERTN